MAIADAKFIVSEASADLNNEILSQNIANLNIIRNGSFEEWGDGFSSLPIFWAAIGGSYQVVKDTGDKDNFGAPYAAKITSFGAGSEGIKYTFSNLKANTKYSVYARAKATSGDTAKIWTTGASTNLSQTTTSTSWTTLVGSFITDGTPTDVVLKIGSDTNTDVVWFDSIMVVEGEAPFAFAPHPLDTVVQFNKTTNPYNLVKNGSFEDWSDGTTAPPDYWSKVGNPTIARDSGEADNFGAYAVKITAAATNEGISYLLTNLKPSTKYSVRARVKVAAADNADITTTGAGDNLYQRSTSTSWEDIRGFFTTDANGSNVTLKLLGVSNGDIVWFDSLLVVEGTTSYAYAPRPIDLPGIWEKVYENEISTAQTEITVSAWDNGQSIDGNKDEMLMCLIFFKNGAGSSTELGVRPNNDSNNNYSRQILDAYGTSVSATRDTPTRFALNFAVAQNQISWSQSYIYLQTGNRRICNVVMQNTTTNDLIFISVQNQWWTNTSDNITSLKFVALQSNGQSQTNGIGAGTHIVVFRKKG
ncbi:MAG: carbohydrate binding domain-containing protein [Planctomycetota bacterium]